ncbi:hypothetical protein [Pseudonocardia sp. H11422]|uniref:hypothetical protein n=1 Tax=Pseudonocardia sp. H11422 TaxID=2835866 RepID=UPI001BDD135D|nr:hypothetical protein [Pseudonocardia sp. H11422]
MLTDPVARLVRNAAHAGIDDEVYDLRQLALAAVDVVVGSMGFAREATPDEVLDVLAGIAARMQPHEERAGEWRDVAQAVVKGLLNDAHEQRRFTYHFAEMSDGDTRFEPYSFRLLSLRESEYGPVLVASDQAVTLFLHGLGVDLEDADRALAYVLQRQLDDHRFDAAVRTAAQAERTSVGMSATLTELLGRPGETWVRTTGRSTSPSGWPVPGGTWRAGSPRTTVSSNTYRPGWTPRPRPTCGQPA